MQVLKRGVEYLLDTSDKEGLISGRSKPVHFLFCHKNDMEEFVHGMTTEEVLRMLIDRQQHMVNKDDSTQNIRLLLFLRQGLDCCNTRNTEKLNRHRRNNNEINGSRNAPSVPPAGEQGG